MHEDRMLFPRRRGFCVAAAILCHCDFANASRRRSLRDSRRFFRHHATIGGLAH